MKVNGAPELLCFPHSSEYLSLCSAEQRNSYRSGNTRGGVNDDDDFLFWVNYPFKTPSPLMLMLLVYKSIIV